MSTNALFEAALQLQGQGWKVVSSSFGGNPLQMEIVMEHNYVGLRCPVCGEQCPGYDAVEKRWRHLNFFQYRCELVAKVPLVNCPRDGVRLSEVPWASAESGLLYLKPWSCCWRRDSPISDVAQMMGGTRYAQL